MRRHSARGPGVECQYKRMFKYLLQLSYDVIFNFDIP